MNNIAIFNSSSGTTQTIIFQFFVNWHVKTECQCHSNLVRYDKWVKDERSQYCRTKFNLTRSSVTEAFAISWWVECYLETSLCHSSGEFWRKTCLRERTMTCSSQPTDRVLITLILDERPNLLKWRDLLTILDTNTRRLKYCSFLFFFFFFFLNEVRRGYHRMTCVNRYLFE